MRRSIWTLLVAAIALPAPWVQAATNVALGKPVTWSNATNSAEDGTKAVDGDITTKWTTPLSPSGEWLQVDLLSTVTIQRWVVKHSSAGGEDHKAWNTRDFALWVWNGSTWQLVDNLPGSSFDITDRTIPPTAGRYFRLTVANGGDNGVRIFELELYTDPLNLAFHKTATASSSMNGQGPSLAVDGSVSPVVDGTSNSVANSKWSSNAWGDKWLEVDLGANTAVSKWVVHHAGAGGENPNWNTRDFQLRGKVNGGSSYTTIDTVTGNRTNTTNRNLTAMAYRYYRLYITNPGSDSVARIYDFQLYSPSEAPITKTPATWQEGGWPGHTHVVSNKLANDDVALYFDSDMTSSDSASWLYNFVRPLWDYQRKTYGTFGLTNQLWIIAHKNYEGQGLVAHSPHWSSYKAYRSTVDCSFDTVWNSTNPNAADLMLLKHFITHEMGHFVECSSNSVEAEEGSCNVANQWGDSKFNAIFQYDVYVGAGYTAEARDLYQWASSDGEKANNLPPGTTGVQWFNDFFYPIWRDHGGGAALARYYQLTREFFPKDRTFYARGMNMGEMIHFMSGAAGVALRTPGVGNGGQAYVAFNKPWNPQWDTELAQAKIDFPGVTYSDPSNGPCAGLCTNPSTITINGSYQSGNLGVGAVCLQTTSPVHGGNCGNFTSPRTLSVNGTVETCDNQNWQSVPAARNGGYCIQTATGNQPWAFVTLW